MKLFRCVLFAFLFHIIVISYACQPKTSKEDDEEMTTPFPRKLVGGISSVTKQEMEDEGFQNALTEALKQLDDVNKCHTFELVKVINASKQVVAGVLYRIQLELRPSFSGETDEDCADFTSTFDDGNRIADVSVVAQLWKDPQHIVTFQRNSDFDHSGMMVKREEMNTWSPMTPEDFKMPVFQKAVEEVIDKFNREAMRCFHYEFVEIVSGEKMLSTKLEFKWKMKVKKVYEYQSKDCRGLCADDCSGTSLYSVQAFVSPPTSEDPQITDVQLERRLSPSFVGNLGPE